MLQEFIDANELNAKIISFSTETPIKVAIKNKKFNPNNIVQSKLFISKEQDLIITISKFGQQEKSELVNKSYGGELLEANDDESIKYTGYKKDFMPPISIFEAKIIIDSKLENREKLIFQITPKKYLQIPLNEIISSNEDVIFSKITD